MVEFVSLSCRKAHSCRCGLPGRDRVCAAVHAERGELRLRQLLLPLGVRAQCPKYGPGRGGGH